MRRGRIVIGWDCLAGVASMALLLLVAVLLYQVNEQRGMILSLLSRQARLERALDLMQYR